MGQALYRKYRSRSLTELVGQPQITQTLESAIKQDKISHAYLFTGPRGVGTTSVARILAHEVNQLPYHDDTPNIDIIEIDAASNRRIDEIRELREKVYVTPVSSKYKVYIIDEVHMLTREAFNALLKTLEEPPEHVIFILATTDAHKLPETIISRTQRFNFRPVSQSDVKQHLTSIAQQESIDITDEAVELLAKYGEGSFRDSISLLDQASGMSGKVSLEDVQRLMGIAPTEAVDELLALSLESSDSSRLMMHLDKLYSQGYRASSLAKQLNGLLRAQLVDGDDLDDSGRGLMTDLIDVPASHDPERALEVILLRAQPRRSLSKPPNKNPESAEPAQLTEQPERSEAEAETQVPEPISKAEVTSPKPAKLVPATQGSLDESSWQEVLKSLKQAHNTLYGVVRMAQPDFSDNGTATLVFNFEFHKKRLEESTNRKKLAETIHEVTGQNLEVVCVLDKTSAPITPAVTLPPAPKTENTPDLAAISNIFGETELLES